MEVRLHNSPSIDRDFLPERLGDAVEHRALYLVLCAAQVNDLAADVTRYPNLVHAHDACVAHACFDNLSEVAPVAEVECNPLPSPSGKLDLPPRGFIGDEL